MHVKLIDGILSHKLSVWIVIRKGRRENHFGLDFVKNKNKISTNKRKAKWRLPLVISFHL